MVGIPAPNPSYKIPVKNVTGNVNVKIQNKNLFISDYSRYTKPVDYNICPIKLEKGKTYTLSAELIGNKLSGQVVGITPYGSKYAEFRLIILIDTQGNTLKKTFTVDDTWTDPKLCVYGLTKQAFDNMFNNYNIQLEEGSTATQYTDHQEQNLPLTLGTTELCKIDTAKDYFYKSSGKWYLHKEIGKVILNGTENWQIANTGTEHWIYLAYLSNFKPITTNGYSNYYPYVTLGGSDTNQGIFAVPDYIRIRWGTEDTIDNFKNWLSNHNVILYYKLATPTETEITDTTLISQLEATLEAMSYYEQTNISSTSSELEAIIEANAVGDLNLILS